MHHSPNSRADDDPFPPVDLVVCPEDPVSSNPVWPSTDHPTLQKLRNGTPDERQAALRDMFLFYLPSIRSSILHKWPELQPAEVEDLASEFVILCLTGEKPQLHTRRQVGTGSPHSHRVATTNLNEIDGKLRDLARVLGHDAPD